MIPDLENTLRGEYREKLRKNPPHILLTNYMMLEYLLVRPADREDIFANHRCRFLVLDEPTSQLDPQAAEEVLDALLKLNRDLGLATESELALIVPLMIFLLDI